MYSDPYDVEVASLVRSLPTSTLAVAVFFSVNTVLFISSWIFGKIRGQDLSEVTNTDTNVKVSSLKLTGKSLYDLSKDLFSLGCILLYIWICENRPIYNHGEKWHDLDFFWFLTFALIVAGVVTIKRDKSDRGDILNREQTEEWKGWMQVMFLLYHYFEVREVYNGIRVLISCYVWMTGFGNFSFFYIKSDFSFVRFYQMMWRLNFLVFFLCMTLNNLYILYYICPLHTFYFLVTYTIMAVQKNINHSKYAARVKLMVAGLFIYIIWEFPAVFNVVFFFLPDTVHQGYAVGRYGVQYEWHFRSGLDHYSTFFGMIFAMNFPQATLWLKQIEEKSFGSQLIAKGGTLGVLLVGFGWYWNNIFFLPKLEYNALHPYVFLLPILAYIFLRNISKILRTYHMEVLEQIGKVTLETYLMQHHIWLTSNAKSLLILLPGLPKLNFLLVTIIYFLVSRKLYRLTISLRARLVPDQHDYAVISLFSVISAASCCYICGWFLQLVNITWSVFFVSMLGLAFAIWKVVLTLKREVNFFKNESNLGNVKRILFVVASISFSSMLILMNTEALYISDVPMDNLGPLRPKISELSFNENTNCLGFLNDFSIRSFDAVKLEHDHEIFVTESKVFKFQKPRLHECKFYAHTTLEIVSLLKGKKILVIGDDTMFLLMKALIALEGESVTEISNNDLINHSTLNNKIKLAGNAELSFVFAPSFEDVQEILDILGDDATEYNSIVFQLKTVESSQYKTLLGELLRTVQMHDERGLVVASPFQLDPQYQTAVSEVLNKINDPDINDEVIGILDLTKLFRSLDSSKIEFNKVAEVAAHILVNNLEVMFKSRNTQYIPGNERLLEASNNIKGSGGGISHDPVLGLVMMGCSALMLLFFDSYYGVSVFFKLISGDDQKVTWELSVRDLHKAIGIVPASAEGIDPAEEFDNHRGNEDEEERLLKLSKA